MQSPPVDNRGYQDLVAGTEQLAQQLSDWRPRPDGQPDAGQALIRVFAHFAEQVVDRLNRAPDKHYLAYLNLIGTSPLPPQSARVPLTFQLAANSPVDAVVPAGVQAAAPPPPGSDEEVTFETERNLIVTRAALQAAFTSDTEHDTWSDRTANATGQAAAAGGDTAEAFAVFQGDLPSPHELYLACDPLLLQPGTKDVTLTLASPDTWQWENWPFTWAWWDGSSWQPAVSTAATAGGAWQVTIAALPPLVPSAVGGIEAGWLRAQLQLPFPPGQSGRLPESVAIGARNPQDVSVPLEPFPVDSPVKRFYLSADDAFGAGGSLARVRFALSRPGAGTNLQLSWYYQADVQSAPGARVWLPLGQSSATAAQDDSSGFKLVDGTQALTRDGELSFHVPMRWPLSLYRTRVGRWLRVDVAAGQYTTPPEIASVTVSYDWELPTIGQVHVAATSSQAQGTVPVPPANAAYNAGPIDLSKDFYPFGEQPGFNDTFYVACPGDLARPGATVRLSVTLTNPPLAAGTPPPAMPPWPVRTLDQPRLAWEVSDGQQWRATAASYAFTGSGELTLALPDPLATSSVNGQDGYWLRARLVGGGYGSAASYQQGGNGTWTFVPATFAPPIVRALSFVAPGGQQMSAPASACVSYNDFAYADHGAVAGGAGATVPFPPFTPTADSDPALYLGFDQPFGNRPATLYLAVEPPEPEDVAAGQLSAPDPAASPQLAWEYWTPGGWQPLGALDETGGLISRGLVGFVGPPDFAPRACFGQTWYWLRLRWWHGVFALAPRLRRVLPSTTWAAQSVTVATEILGSSSGNPGQLLGTAQAPVQPGQQLVVREPQRPSPADEQALIAVEGAGAVSVVPDPSGQSDEVWVRWHAVSDFYQSGTRDRHYTIDALSGQIRFGDGVAGMVPPPGQNNLRITYRSGGGEQGNQPAGTIVELKSAIPYVDSVTNYEAAQGGAPLEPIERLQDRGPRVLRHRDRAVAAQDLEDLAAAASAEVARAVAVVPAFNPNALWLDPAAPAPTADHAAVDAGRMGVVVVPASDADRPTPSLGLLAEVQAYVQARCPVTADLWVAGPEWIAVTVQATVTPVTIEDADALRDRVTAALQRFLHPLTGGPDGQGWAFGSRPHHSDLIALAEAVPGVDHVDSLAVSFQPRSDDPDRRLALQRLLQQALGQPADQSDPDHALQGWLDRALIYSGTHAITIALD
jgi:hypothetical protein